MAIWQASYTVIPLDGALRILGVLPDQMKINVHDRAMFWKDPQGVIPLFYDDLEKDWWEGVGPSLTLVRAFFDDHLRFDREGPNSLAWKFSRIGSWDHDVYLELDKEKQTRSLTLRIDQRDPNARFWNAFRAWARITGLVTFSNQDGKFVL